MQFAVCNSYQPKFNEKMNETIRNRFNLPSGNEFQTQSKQREIDIFMNTAEYNWLMPTERRAVRRLRIALNYLRSAYHAFETGEIEPYELIHRKPK
jgi:hypothetical protein